VSDLESPLREITKTDAQTLDVRRVGVWFFDKDHAEIVCKNLYESGENKYEHG